MGFGEKSLMEDLCDILNIGELKMPKYTRRLTAETAKKLGLQPAIRTAPPAPKKTPQKPCGTFEQEYQDFIAKLKAKKEAEAAAAETKVEEPVVETVAEEAPVDIAEEPVVEEKPKKTRKKKAEVVDEAPVQETTTEE